MGSHVGVDSVRKTQFIFLSGNQTPIPQLSIVQPSYYGDLCEITHR
jgi:hypothetical protein